MKKWVKILKAELGDRVHTDPGPGRYGYNANCEHCEIVMPYVRMQFEGLIK